MRWEVRTMRSVTSYFNPTLYKKNLSRFWPLWAAWLVLWLFLLPLNLLNEYVDLSPNPADYQRDLYRYFRDCLNLNNWMSETSLILAMGFAVVCVMAVYGYLFNHRSAATMHALPMRRETLFVTNYLSGVSFFLFPNVVVFALTALIELVTLPAELSAFTLPCLWSGFWVATGCTFFFYSFGVFCAQFTGNILALPAFYGILNFLVYTMYTLLSSLAQEIFYGGWPFLREPVWVRLLTPIYALAEASHWNNTSWVHIWNDELNRPELWRDKLNLAFEDPGMVAGYAVAGVVLAVLALLVYRRRHIETAGDVVSVKVVRPIFRAGVAVCAGLCGGILMTAFFGWLDSEVSLLASILVWTVVGFFVAEMLLNKTFRVFKKSWKGCLVTAAVMALAMLACFLDVFGVETWVPDPAQVDSAFIYINSTYPYDDAAHVMLDIEDSAEIEKIVDLHQAIIDDYKEYGDTYFGEELMHVRLNYVTERGTEYVKSYNLVNILPSDINEPGTTTYLLNEYVNDPTVIERCYDLENARRGIPVCAELVNVIYPSGRYGSEQLPEGAAEIWEAVQADFAAGNLGVRYLFDDEVRRTQTYYTDLRLRFLLPEEDNGEYEDLYYEKYVMKEPVPTPTEESAYTWNWSMTVTLTPMAERTIAALEKYSGLGGAYDIALHEE